MNKVEILIISDLHDFTTDYICIELNKRNRKYLRINRDEFDSYSVFFDIGILAMQLVINNVDYIVNDECLKTVYYRAPIYLHFISKKTLSYEQQLYKSQWTAFIRNLAVYKNAKWMNYPASTFSAENKMYQLSCAKEIGFMIPSTSIVNSIDNINIDPYKDYIVKTLDSVILRGGEEEGFIYSSIVKGEELLTQELSTAPFILQENLDEKIDIRATVVNEGVFAVSILQKDTGINGDWRKHKDNLEFKPVSLPKPIEALCAELVSKLKLHFGGVDLIYSKGKYYFIEVNPTGEWAWLIDKTQDRIDIAICDFLDGTSERN